MCYDIKCQQWIFADCAQGLRAHRARDGIPGLASPGDATKPPWRQDFTVWSFDGTSAAKLTVGKILPFPNEAGASLGTPFVLALGSIQTLWVWMEEEEFYCPSMRQCEHCLMTKQ